jgi:hypothetical protein
MAGEGVANEEIAWRVGVTPNTVRRWRGSSSSKKVRRGRTSLSEVTSRRAATGQMGPGMHRRYGQGGLMTGTGPAKPSRRRDKRMSRVFVDPRLRSQPVTCAVASLASSDAR